MAQFDYEQLKKTERRWQEDEKTASEIHRGIVQGMGQMLTGILTNYGFNLSELAVKGFINFGVNDWMQEYGTTLEDLAGPNTPVATKAVYGKQVTDAIGARLERIMWDKKQVPNLNAAMAEGYKAYKQVYLKMK